MGSVMTFRSFVTRVFMVKGKQQRRKSDNREDSEGILWIETGRKEKKKDGFIQESLFILIVREWH